MSKYSEIFDYMRQCPQLKNLWSIGATATDGVSVILPQGGSQTKQYNAERDVLGDVGCAIEPYLTVYEDYQINCYKFYDSNDSSAPSANINVITLDEVQEICDWVTEQSDKDNLPNITGRKVIDIECVPTMPQIRFVDEAENLIGYFVTIRIHFVNEAKRKWREFAMD